MFKVTVTFVLLLLAVCLVGAAVPAGQIHLVTANMQLRSFPGGTDDAATMVLANTTTARLNVFSESGG